MSRTHPQTFVQYHPLARKKLKYLCNKKRDRKINKYIR